MLTDYIFENVLRNPLRFLPMEIVARAARVEGALETSQLWALIRVTEIQSDG